MGSRPRLPRPIPQRRRRRDASGGGARRGGLAYRAGQPPGWTMNLAKFPRRRYTPYATAIEPLTNLSRALGGPNLWIKRDDTLGLASGGNKTRKLEFLVADALAQG